MHWVSEIGLGLLLSTLVISVLLSASHAPIESASPFYWLMNIDLLVFGAALLIYGELRSRR